MKLINKIDIDEAANDVQQKYPCLSPCTSFTAGVFFAEEKIIPLMIEFADWMKTKTSKSNIHGLYCINGHYSSAYTTVQLLEHFLKTKDHSTIDC